MGAVLNALTVDVEDYFHVSALAPVVARSDWDYLESRVCRNTDRLLEIFARSGVYGTFFVLGWVAERFPDLVRRIHSAGHELASHGYEHGLVYDLTPEAFRHDIRRAKSSIEDAAGVPVVGYRAPSFSITERSLWAFDVLLEEGYEFDASVYPIHHDRYGIPAWERQIGRVKRLGGEIVEVPGATIRRLGVNWPVGGGAYFRLLPYWWTAYCVEAINRFDQAPAMFYLHPWEIDPDQPRFEVGLLTRIRHYRNLSETEPRLERLLGQFRFGPVSAVLRQQRGALAHVGSAVGVDRSNPAGAPS